MDVRVIFLGATLGLVTAVTSQEGICPTTCTDYATKQDETREMWETMVQNLKDRMTTIESMNADLVKKAKRQAKKIEELEYNLKKIKSDEPSGSSRGKYGPWTPWTKCSVTCGIGNKRRTRKCYGDNPCTGLSQIQLPCKISSCAGAARPQVPTNPASSANWGEWSEWTECKTTGRCFESSVAIARGTRNRSRKCGLRFCPGSSSEVQVCTGICVSLPTGLYTPWTEWTRCTVTCGVGVVIRRRDCISGVACRGTREERKECDQGPCAGGMAEKTCELQRKENCYMVIDSESRSTRTKHEELCKEHGGHLANIYDAEHLESLEKYILGRQLASSYLWTGMNYNVGKGLTLDDGSKAMFEQWTMANPAAHPLWTGILFHVEDKRGIDLDRVIVAGKDVVLKAGFRNMSPSSKYRYSICEFMYDGSP